MKGVIFTEFLDHVERGFGAAMVDMVIDRARPASGGAYTAVGSYPFSELAALVTELARATGTPVPVLLRQFGCALFHRFAVLYPELFAGRDDMFALLATIESTIHTEVRKLYPDATPPRFDVAHAAADEIVLIYRSCRPLGDFCLGLIEGCAEYFGERIELTATRVASGEPAAPPGDGLRFEIRRAGGRRAA